MTDRDHDEDLWQELDRLPPAGPDRVHRLMLRLTVLIEVVFILAFSRLVRLARLRRLGH
jgi:hypothetical protein